MPKKPRSHKSIIKPPDTQIVNAWQAHEDIKFLITFVPAHIMSGHVPKGMPDDWYASGFFDGDIELAARISKIKERYIFTE